VYRNRLLVADWLSGCINPLANHSFLCVVQDYPPTFDFANYHIVFFSLKIIILKPSLFVPVASVPSCLEIQSSMSAFSPANFLGKPLLVFPQIAFSNLGISMS
jgi:hypothetical protein